MKLLLSVLLVAQAASTKCPFDSDYCYVSSSSGCCSIGGTYTCSTVNGVSCTSCQCKAAGGPGDSGGSGGSGGTCGCLLCRETVTVDNSKTFSHTCSPGQIAWVELLDIQAADSVSAFTVYTRADPNSNQYYGKASTAEPVNCYNMAPLGYNKRVGGAGQSLYVTIFNKNPVYTSRLKYDINFVCRGNTSPTERPTENPTERPTANSPTPRPGVPSSPTAQDTNPACLASPVLAASVLLTFAGMFFTL